MPVAHRRHTRDERSADCVKGDKLGVLGAQNLARGARVAIGATTFGGVQHQPNGGVADGVSGDANASVASRQHL